MTKPSRPSSAPLNNGYRPKDAMHLVCTLILENGTTVAIVASDGYHRIKREQKSNQKKDDEPCRREWESDVLFYNPDHVVTFVSRGYWHCWVALRTGKCV
jgi:hypothetical protein